MLDGVDEGRLQVMDDAGVDTQVLSALGTIVQDLDRAESIIRSRELDERLAHDVTNYPDRFRFLGSLPCKCTCTVRYRPYRYGPTLPSFVSGWPSSALRPPRRLRLAPEPGGHLPAGSPAIGRHPIALPVNLRVRTKTGGKKTTELAAEMVAEIVGWLPERSLHLTGDGAYACLLLR